MSNWQQLDEHLGKDFSMDYWEDEALLEGASWLEDFDENDWQALAQSWPQRSPTWRKRCAQVLSEAEPVKAVPILVELIAADDESVAIAAADSLRSIGSQGTPVKLSPAVTDRVRLLIESHPGVVAKALSPLLAMAGR